METRVLIGNPNPGQVCSQTVESIIDLIQASKVEVKYKPWLTTYIDIARAELVFYAGFNKFSHILFIDSDNTFPPDTLNRLLDRQQYVIGASYRRRRPTSDGKHYFTAMVGNEDVDPTGKEGIVQVDGIGFGVILLDLRVFQMLKEPYFAYSDLYEGEDYCFCKRCKDGDVPVFVDYDLSKDVGHLATVELRA